MANLFKAVRGTLITSDPDKSPASIVTVSGLDLPVDLMLVTQVAIERNQITQYIKTLDKNNFGYAWGEGPGTIMVSGIVFFTQDCSISGEGIERINSYYDSNNVYDNPSPISIAIGGAAFEGYLEKLRLSAQQNEYNFGEFSLQFTILPKE